MKNIILTIAAVCAAMTVSAEAFYSIVNTVAYGKDAKPSDAHASYYSGYLCTVASAADFFGGNTSAAGMTDYVSGHYQEVLSDLSGATVQDGVLGLSADVEGYTAGQYAAVAYSGVSLAGSDYLALLLYNDGENEAFRAFGLGSADTIGAAIAFDDDGNAAATKTVGAWTAPEPAGGLLLLFGLAGLALRRRRA